MEWVPGDGWLTKVGIDAAARAARRSTSRSTRPGRGAVAGHGRSRPAGRDRRRRGPLAPTSCRLARRARVHRRRDRRHRAADPAAPAAVDGLTAGDRPCHDAPRRSPAADAVRRWPAASPCRSGLAGRRRPPGPTRAGLGAGHGRDRHPLLALRAGRGDRPGRASRSRSCCATSDPIDHEWIVGDAAVHERHRTGTEPVHASRPTEVTHPGRVDARRRPSRSTTPGTYLYICHLPGHEAYGMVGSSVTVADRPRDRRRGGPPLSSAGATAAPALRRDRRRPAGRDRAGRAGAARQPAADQGPRLHAPTSATRSTCAACSPTAS